MFNKDFYPTPPGLIRRMLAKIRSAPDNILEPSAGKGDIVMAIKEKYGRYNYGEIAAIEKDDDLRATLLGKQIKVIDSDFLTFSGPDKFDLIIANPPFDGGEKHLLKAIEIIYRGQIIFLLNAETIRNPFSNTRKELVRKLGELGADIEYIKNAFVSAERPTGVEIALINIEIKRVVEEDLFAGVEDAASVKHGLDEKHEVSAGLSVRELVAEYNDVVQTCIDATINYFRNYKKIGRYIGFNKDAEKHTSGSDMTAIMQKHVNHILVSVRKDFWRRTLDLREVNSRLTGKKQSEFEHAINQRCDMDFTENNIRQFVLNLIGGYEKTITESVVEIFDMFTIRHTFDDNNRHEKNIHYFNGWKTNKAFKVNRRVVIPIYGGYGGPFVSWGKWTLSWDAAKTLRDIDVVMNYFDGMREYRSLSDSIKTAFSLGQSSSIESTYFTVTCYKKGTIHFKFKDEDILRRFNVVACKGKGWLPCDYGAKGYEQLGFDEKAVVDSFEGKKSYGENINKPLFAQRELLMLAAA